MEREGSVYAKIYEVLLAGGKKLPVVEDKNDRVVVTVYGRLLDLETVRLMDKVSNDFQLKQRELIALGMIAQHRALLASELRSKLSVNDSRELESWIGALTQHKLVLSRGRTKGTQYFVSPELLRKIGFKGKITLKQIEDHRLRELILADLKVFPESAISEIHERIGWEIPLRNIRAQLKSLAETGLIDALGNRRWRRYSVRK